MLELAYMPTYAEMKLQSERKIEEARALLAQCREEEHIRRERARRKEEARAAYEAERRAMYDRITHERTIDEAERVKRAEARIAKLEAKLAAALLAAGFPGDTAR